MEERIQSEIIKAWENLSDYYQKSTRISTYDVHYGPLAYGEEKLHLLGDVKGKKVLEIGCGGGQNTIALARWGATAYGVDPSYTQILYARRLAAQSNVDATFVTASAEAVPFKEHFDIVLSSYAFGYVANIENAYQEVRKILKKNGIFVLCVGHPYFHAVGFYLAEDPDEPEIRNYLSGPEIVTWQWECYHEKIQMWSYRRTLSQIINPLLKMFTLEKMVEQGIEDVAAMLDEEKKEIPYLYGGDEKEYCIQRKLPNTLILKLRKV